MTAYNDFDARLEELTKDICIRLGIRETDWRRYSSIVQNELIKAELQNVLKKDVLVECTTSEMLKMIKSEGQLLEDDTTD